ncbi:MAG: hypothetical protein GF308_12615 [Candidatus Heimdallarchaeota archaeon]|nr:hypothetical protein [Candidatus Heimdallarchaeota archaeon]
MSGRRLRGATMHFEFEIDADTKTLLEDLLTQYPNTEIIIKRAIETLHKQHFGSLSEESEGQKPPSYQADILSNQKLNELIGYIQEIREEAKGRASSTVTVQNNKDVPLSSEANQKILAKIEELGVKFSKITAPEQSGKIVTTEMSKEEVLQLIKRIDQLESKLTRAISQSRVAAAAPARSRSGRTMDEPPKIGKVQKIDGATFQPEERPMLDDVLNTVIVSVDDEEEE